MASLELFGIIKDGAFQCSKDSSIAEADWLRDNEGEMVRKAWHKKKPPKTTEQIRLLYACLHAFARYLHYGDMAVLKLDVKESIGYYEFIEVTNLSIKEKINKKEYRSFADLKIDSPYIGYLMDLCNEQGFPMREFYNIYKQFGLDASKKAIEEFLQERVE